MPNDLMPDTSSYADPTGNALLAKGYDPNTAAQGMIATMQGAQNLQMNKQVMTLRNAQIGQEQLALGRQKLTALNGVLGGLVANPTADNATSQIGWAVQNGVIDPDSATKAAGEIAALGGDPAKIKAWATDHLNQNAQHQQLMEQAYGTPGTVSNGAVTSPVMVKSGAQGGIYPAAGPDVVQQMGPGEAASPTAGPLNPDGSPTVISKGQFAARQGSGAAVVTPFGAIAYPGRTAGATPTAGAPAPSAPPSPISFGGGSAAPSGAAPAAGGQPQMITPAPSTLPVITQDQANAAMANFKGGKASAVDRNVLRGYAVQNNVPLDKMGPFEPQPAGVGAAAPNVSGQPGGPQPSVPPSPQGPAPGAGQPAAQPQGAAVTPTGAPMTVGLAPGVAEGRSVVSAANAKMVTDLQSAADTVPQQNAAIDNLGAQLGKISTGPIAGKINTAKATYNQIAQMAGLPQVDPQGVAAMEEFHKSSAQLAGASMAALGGAGTNDKLALALAQNPGETLSNMGNAQVIPLLKGLNAAVTVKNEAAQTFLQSHGGDPSSYGASQADWNKNFSPRAFQFAFMSPEQRSDLIGSMSPAEQGQLANALQTAEQRGWIKPGQVQ